MKKVIFIVIDALTARLVEPAMEDGRLPHLHALSQAGSFDPKCRAIFPSITHAATASIATGRYPREHGIAGMNWYNAAAERVVYYGADLWVILNKGLAEFLEDFAIKLNHRWLQAETIFQTVERADLRAACINHLIFHGDTTHQINTPQLLELLTAAPSQETVSGPSMLGLGDFISIFPQNIFDKLTGPISGGPLHRFGFEDDHTADVLIRLAETGNLPDFTLAYFPDNDDQSHKLGPEAALETIEHIDERLGEFFTACGGLQRLLDEYCLILTGDHAQSDIESEVDTAGIQLDDLLADFSLAPAGQAWREQDQLIVCPNLRMAQIYFKQPTSTHIERVVKQLLSEPRVDQVMWRGELMGAERRGYFVRSAGRGAVHFWSDNNGPDAAKDVYGGRWSWRGELDAVGGHVSEGVISFADYPNAFERIAAGLDCPTGGHLWATARPGYEFTRREMSVHDDGGSHGSLHALDSLVPLILAGAPAGVNLPANPRTVDLVPLCLTILELEPSRAT